MTSPPEKQTFAMHLLPNIFRGEGKEADNEIWSVIRI